MSLKRFNLNKFEAASAQIRPRLTGTDMMMYQTSNSDARTDQIMRSVLSKKEISRQDFNKGAVNAGIIFLGREYRKAAEQLAKKTVEASPNLTTKEMDAVKQMAYYVQLPEQSGPFQTGVSYVQYQNKKRPKTIFKEQFVNFVIGLNKLYKKDVWFMKFTVVNGVPDSPYFVPVETPVAIPKDISALPLGFSYDTTLRTVRVYYIITGDVMFGYVYDDPEEALKGRFIHSMMLDWALPPEKIAAMYQKWYGSPKIYDIVFKELHKEKFGEYPKLRISTPALTAGGEVLSKSFPDWRDQRVIRDTILSNFAGLSGITGNSDFTWELHEEIVNGQRANISGKNLQKNLFDQMDIYTVKNKSQFNNIPDAPAYIQNIIKKHTS